MQDKMHGAQTLLDGGEPRSQVASENHCLTVVADAGEEDNKGAAILAAPATMNNIEYLSDGNKECSRYSIHKMSWSSFILPWCEKDANRNFLM
eukprot:12911222-Ditylum_brightwellii.AAC.1